MGAACCVAARDKTIPVISSSDHRNWNSRYSPTWSFRWENRGRVAGEDASVGWSPDGINTNHMGMDSKLEMTYVPAHGGSLDGFDRRMMSKSPLYEGTVGHVRNSGSGTTGGELFDPSISRAIPTGTPSQQVESRESSAHVFPSPAKLSMSSSPSNSSPLTLSSCVHLQHASSTPSMRSNHSQKLVQLLPGNMTPADESLRSPTPTTAVAMPPTPPWTYELNRGSSGGLSDGWSVNGFNELAFSSYGGGDSSLGSEAKDMSPDSICKTDSRMSASTSGGLQACSVCLKSLTERSSWSGQNIIANIELPVAAVLICGHVYHADCLEVMTSNIDKYDPTCPVCTLGEQQTFEMSKKALVAKMQSSIKRDRQSRNQGVDNEASRDLARLRIGGSKSSSSVSRSPSSRTFFRRHFSFGSREIRALTEVHPNPRRALFWTRSSKE